MRVCDLKVYQMKIPKKYQVKLISKVNDSIDFFITRYANNRINTVNEKQRGYEAL